MKQIAIQTNNLGKTYQIVSNPRTYKTFREDIANRFKMFLSPNLRSKQDKFCALEDINLTIWKGEAVGIIGSNGSGKSTLLKLFSRVTWPTTGSLEIHGRIGSLLEIGTGFHPELSGRENIYLSGAILGMRREEITRLFDEIVEFSGVGDFLNMPVKRYSSGMFLRLAFSIMAHLQSNILIIDEVLAVGDQVFQQKCIKKIKDLIKEGRTLIFVSHIMDALITLCHRFIWIEKGKLLMDGPSQEIIKKYQQVSY